MLFIVDYTGIMKKRQERVGKRKRSNRKRSKRNPEFSEKPVILIGMLIGGLLHLAFPILVIAGIWALFTSR